MSGSPWSRAYDDDPARAGRDAYTFSLVSTLDIGFFSGRRYREVLYPGPRLGHAYGRAMHRAMKKLRRPIALAAAYKSLP